jgi:predicted transcriptional regulator
MSETTKERAIQVIQRLPEDATIEDIMYELELCARIERGIREDAEGKLIPQEEVVRRMSKWLKSAGP